MVNHDLVDPDNLFYPYDHSSQGVRVYGVNMLGFSPDTNEDKARAVFFARFGRWPSLVISTAGALLVGPIDED